LGAYGLALAALALVVFGADDSYPFSLRDFHFEILFNGIFVSEACKYFLWDVTGALLVVLLSARVAPGQPPPSGLPPSGLPPSDLPPDRLGRKVNAELEANAVDSTSQAPALPALPVTPSTAQPQPRAHSSWTPTSPRLRNRTSTTPSSKFLILQSEFLIHQRVTIPKGGSKAVSL